MCLCINSLRPAPTTWRQKVRAAASAWAWPSSTAVTQRVLRFLCQRDEKGQSRSTFFVGANSYARETNLGFDRAPLPFDKNFRMPWPEELLPAGQYWSDDSLFDFDEKRKRKNVFSFFIEKEESYRRRADPSSTVVILWKDLFCLFLSLVCACIRSSPFDKSVRNHNAQPHYSTTLARWIELYRAAAMKEGPTWHRQTKNMKRIYSGEEVIFPGNMSGLAPPSSVTAEKFNVTRLLRQTLYTIHTRPCCRLCGTGGDFFIIKLLIARLSLSLQLCRAHISLSLSSHTHTQIFGPGCVAQSSI